MDPPSDAPPSLKEQLSPFADSPKLGDLLDKIEPMIQLATCIIFIILVVLLAAAVFQKGGVPLLHGVDKMSWMKESFTVRNPVDGKLVSIISK